jgi:integrase
MAAFSGLPRKELASLRWEDLHLSHGWVVLRASRTKNKQGRKRHPLPLDILSLLHQLRTKRLPLIDSDGRRNVAYSASNNGSSDPVFPSVPGCATLKRDLERAGVRGALARGSADERASDPLAVACNSEQVKRCSFATRPICQRPLIRVASGRV